MPRILSSINDKYMSLAPCWWRKSEHLAHNFRDQDDGVDDILDFQFVTIGNCAEVNRIIITCEFPGFRIN